MSFKEKYKTWSKMVVQAYDMSGKTMKPRKNCSKEERILQKRYKELRKIQRRERKERIANNDLNAEI